MDGSTVKLLLESVNTFLGGEAVLGGFCPAVCRMVAPLCLASRDRDRFEDDPYLGSLPHSFAACPYGQGVLVLWFAWVGILAKRIWMHLKSILHPLGCEPRPRSARTDHDVFLSRALPEFGGRRGCA